MATIHHLLLPLQPLAGWPTELSLRGVVAGRQFFDAAARLRCWPVCVTARRPLGGGGVGVISRSGAWVILRCGGEGRGDNNMCTYVHTS